MRARSRYDLFENRIADQTSDSELVVPGCYRSAHVRPSATKEWSGGETISTWTARVVGATVSATAVIVVIIVGSAHIRSRAPYWRVRKEGCRAGVLEHKRGRLLGVPEIVEMLGTSDVRFAVADVGRPLMWIIGEQVFGFWKGDAKPRIMSGTGLL